MQFRGGGGPPENWENKMRVRVRALIVMDLESHVLTGLPYASSDHEMRGQDGGKSPPAVMDLAFFR